MQEGISAKFGRKVLEDLKFKRGPSTLVFYNYGNLKPNFKWIVYLQKRLKSENIESNFLFCCFQIPIIKVDSNQKLGEWAGLCKLDAEGKARKVVRCSSVVVRDWGKESPAHDIIKDYIKSQH